VRGLRLGTGAALMFLVAAAPGALHAAVTSERWTYGPFGEVTIYSPAGAPDQVVLFLSGDGGWNLGVVPMADRLRGLGALVVGIDIRVFQRKLDAGPGACAYAAGALEQLARAVQLRARLPEYKRPMLVGYSSGATLVYAVLASAPIESFAGGISLGFCPDIAMHKAPCRGRGLESSPRKKGIGYDLAVAPALGVPWMVLQGDIDQVCNAQETQRFVGGTDSGRLFWLPKVGHGFGVTRNWDRQYVEAYRELARVQATASARPDHAAPSAPEVADLSLVEVPARDESGDLFAVLITGDGGWAGIDKAIGAQLAADGVPVVGWSSLRYFWQPRDPEGAAADLGRILAHYRRAWAKSRVLLLGYSFGADVLPFLVNRLAASERSAVSAVALIGLSPQASFEFHVAGWLAEDGDPRYPTAAEVDRVKAPTLCLVGAKEFDSACHATHARVVSLPGGHHFGGDYARLSRTILDFVTQNRARDPRIP
jgi:type IV secretory pathway VirJ component